MSKMLTMTRLGFGLVLALVFAVAALKASEFESRAQWFPLFIALGGAVLGLVSLGLDIVKVRSGEDLLSDDDLESGLRRKSTSIASSSAPDETGSASEALEEKSGWYWSVVLASYFALVAVLGFILGSVIWLPAFLIYFAKVRIAHAIVGSVLLVGLLVTLSLYLNVRFANSLLFDVQTLPFGEYLT